MLRGRKDTEGGSIYKKQTSKLTGAKKTKKQHIQNDRQCNKDDGNIRS